MGFLDGVKVIDSILSKYNGKVEVIKSFAWGTYIQVEGLTQSGGVVEGIWKKTLNRVKNLKKEVKTVLILGLGGGSVAKLINKNWPKASLTGIDIDPVMINMGKKHLGLNKIKIKVKIADAMAVCPELSSQHKKFDLIIVDLYKGYEFPEKFEEAKFPSLVKKLLNKDGVAVFNRLYTQGTSSKATKFGRNLQKIFPNVEFFYPEANLMLICTS